MILFEIVFKDKNIIYKYRMEDKQLIINLQNENKRLKELLKKNNIIFTENEEVIEDNEEVIEDNEAIEEKTFLFDLICNDLIEEIMKNIKWFKSIDKKHNIITIHRLNFIKEPTLDYSKTFYYHFYKDYKNNHYNDYWTSSNKRTDEGFSEKRGRKYKTDKKGLLNYNFKYRQFKEIKC